MARLPTWSWRWRLAPHWLPDESLGAEHGEPALHLSVAVAAEALPTPVQGADMMAAALAEGCGASEGLAPVC